MIPVVEEPFAEFSSDNLLLVFLRNPVPGKVKTRIAAETNEAQALEIYEHLYAHTIRVVKQCKVNVRWCFSDFVPENMMHEDTQIQQGNSLGERMLQAFSSALKEYKRAVVIGSDCPYLIAEDIDVAFHSLNKHDVVFGPAEDGGYYLMGMSSIQEELFKEIDWGTDKVLRQSLEACQILNLNTSLLKTYPDIDHYSDWIRYITTQHKTVNPSQRAY
ncbi:MAG: TIGR04282 family arsenosugar biosynthesis glycosyltransferase [Saprospiraceae bacterium]